MVILYSIGREKKGKLRSVRNKTIMKGKEIKDLSDDSTVERRTPARSRTTPQRHILTLTPKHCLCDH